MKKLFSLLLAAAMVLTLAACGVTNADSNAADEPKNNAAADAADPAPTEETPESTGSKVLVAYFSATGNTKAVAETLSKTLSADLFELVPQEPYTDADLDWHDKSSRSSVEMADASSRPALRSQPQNLAAYDTIYIGFPIWWNLAPRIINSFIEKGDFTGKILIPFATSGGSRISNAEQELKKAYPNLNWQKGRLMNGATKEEIKQWTKK